MDASVSNAHVPSLRDLFKLKPTMKIVAMVAWAAESVISCNSQTEMIDLPAVGDFVAGLSFRANLSMAVLMLALVYLDRLKALIGRDPKSIGIMFIILGRKCSVHRIVLASLCISMKNLHDVPPISNAKWALYCRIFSLQDLNQMERELLVLLVRFSLR